MKIKTKVRAGGTVKSTSGGRGCAWSICIR